MSIAEQILKDEFGVPFRESENPVTTTVNNSSTQILENNPDRVGVVVVNTGSNDIFIKFQNDVTANDGIQLVSAGGSVSFNVLEDMTIPTRQMFAITDSGTSQIYTLAIEGYNPAQS